MEFYSLLFQTVAVERVKRGEEDAGVITDGENGELPFIFRRINKISEWWIRRWFIEEENQS